MIQHSKKHICLIGAGLGNTLLAWLLQSRHPHLQITIFEMEKRIPRGRTWSFHESDIAKSIYELVKDLASHHWPSYEVAFPKFRRRYQSGYSTITPEKLESQLLRTNIEFRFNSKVTNIDSRRVVLSDGQEFSYDCVIDGRGHNLPRARQGYQKFVGQNLRLKSPHGLICPVLMDATVPQVDGYRFFYLLPWSDNDLLIEDTRYSSSAMLDEASIKNEIHRYASEKGWQINKVLSTESGTLPLPFESDIIPKSDIPTIGLAGGLFHPVTGYSLPDSLRLADKISSLDKITTNIVAQTIEGYRAEQSLRKKFYYLLNRMMFLAAKPTERRKIFEHFYSLPEELIQRFYAGNTNFGDCLRLLTGRPPVPVLPAIRSMFSQKQPEAL